MAPLKQIHPSTTAPARGCATPRHATSHARRCLCFALLLGLYAHAARGGPPVAAIQITPQALPAAVQESQIKAAYLIKFTQYTTWPAATFESETAPLVVGYGSVGMTADLEQQARAIAGLRPIVIRAVTTPEEAALCHAVFISRNEEGWLPTLRDKPVLTVGETDYAIERGVVIRFVLEGKKLRFDVSRPAMERAGLRLSSDMLRYARKVHSEPPPAR